MAEEQRLAAHCKEHETFLKWCKSAFDIRWASKLFETATINDFNRIQTLGAGAFGRVMLVIHKETGKPYAMKVMDKHFIVKQKEVMHTLSEIKVLDGIRFTFIVSLEYYFKDFVYLFICLPFINGGCMFNHLRKAKKYDEDTAMFYSAQVVLALEYMHYCGLIYRDLKPENLLIDKDGYVKVTDLGFAKKITNRTYSLCGTPEYIAPEIILNKGYGFSADWWSCGILIYELAAGVPPFGYCKNPMKTYEKITKGKFTCPAHFSPELKELVLNILQTDLTRRFGNLKNGVRDIKGAAWFKPLDWAAVLARKVTPAFVPKTSNPGDAGNFEKKEEEPWITSEVDLYPDEFSEIRG